MRDEGGGTGVDASHSKPLVFFVLSRFIHYIMNIKIKL